MQTVDHTPKRWTMRLRQTKVALLMLAVLPGVIAAADTPQLTWRDDGRFVLSIPYLEFSQAGTTTAYSAILHSAELFTFSLDSASVQAVQASTDHPMPRSQYSRTEFAGKTYLIGGQHLQANGVTVPTPTVEIFDSLTNQWRLGTPLPHPHFAHVTLVINDKLYVVGGGYDTFYSLNLPFTIDTPLIDIYDPVLDSWEAALTMPITNPLLVYADSDFLYLFGIKHVNAAATGPFVWYSEEVYRYALNNRSSNWEKLADLPVSISYYSLQASSIEGQLYLMIYDWDTATQAYSIEKYRFRYDTANATWLEEKP